MYLSPVPPGVSRQMSRPQFPVNQLSVNGAPGSMPGHVVNGGLIDFQDNFHRGMAEYAQYVNAQQAAGYQSIAAGYPTPSSLLAGYQHPNGLAQAAPQAVAGLPQSTILGHPSFINVAGKMYRPVEEPRAVETAAEPPVQPRALTEDDIERRVQQRVDEWAASQRKPVSVARAKGRGVTDEERAAARVKSVNAGMYQQRGGFYSPA